MSKVKFYYVEEPYWAVIRASNPSELQRIYNDYVSEIPEDEEGMFQECFELMNEDDVKATLAKCYDDFHNGVLFTPDKIQQELDSEEPGVVVLTAEVL